MNWKDHLKIISKNLTQPEIADILNVSYHSIKGWFAGSRNPRKDTQKEIEKLYKRVIAGEFKEPDWAELIKKIIEKRDITVSAFARECNVNYRTISRIMKGESKPQKKLRKIILEK